MRPLVCRLSRQIAFRARNGREFERARDLIIPGQRANAPLGYHGSPALPNRPPAAGPHGPGRVPCVLGSPVLAACLLSSLLSASALADPIQPPVTDAFGWADGEARRFSLSWNGTQAAFSVDQVGSSTYTSLETCCDDVFSRIRDLNPGGSLLFNGLALNTMPISTSFVDGLNLALLKSQTHNIATLDGLRDAAVADRPAPRARGARLHAAGRARPRHVLRAAGDGGRQDR